MKVKRFVKEFKPIEIKEPFKPDVLEFTDPNDFTKYYREHEEEFENISTYKLNIKYKIPGYKISQKGKKNNDSTNSPEIILIKDYRAPNNKDLGVKITEPKSEVVAEVTRTIQDLEKRINNIENYLSTQ